jgi:transcriptional repressor NrdR
LVVVKRDSHREEFDREKLFRSIRLACVKRPLPTGALEKLISEIESDLQRLGRSEVPASVIGDAALNRLREIDSVAYVRYASVYRDFDTLDGFVQEIRAYQSADVAPTVDPQASQLELIPNEYAIPPKPKARRGRRPSITQPTKASYSSPESQQGEAEPVSAG